MYFLIFGGNPGERFGISGCRRPRNFPVRTERIRTLRRWSSALLRAFPERNTPLGFCRDTWRRTRNDVPAFPSLADALGSPFAYRLRLGVKSGRNLAGNARECARSRFKQEFPDGGLEARKDIFASCFGSASGNGTFDGGIPGERAGSPCADGPDSKVGGAESGGAALSPRLDRFR